MASCSIRRLAGTLPDAQALLAVEQKTFAECPYTAEELLGRLRAPEQRVWVAECGGQVVGFVAGLRTAGLHGPRLEADLLAVHPDWQRQGIATALLLALRRDALDAGWLRGVVGLHNPASSAAFSGAGFVPSAEACDLMLYRILGHVPRPTPQWGGVVRPLRSLAEAEQLASLADGDLPPAGRIWGACQASQADLLAAVEGESVVGAAELLQVDTLLYSGLWLEGVHVHPDHPRAQSALIAAAVEAGKERGLDEVGCLAPQGRWPLRASLQTEGFVALDAYRIWTAPALAPGTLQP